MSKSPSVKEVSEEAQLSRDIPFLYTYLFRVCVFVYVCKCMHVSDCVYVMAFMWWLEVKFWESVPLSPCGCQY